MDRNRTASIALIVILIAATIGIVAFVMSNGSTPVGPAIPGGGGGSAIEGWNQLTPVVPTVAAINCQNGTITCSDGGSGVLNLAVVTPTPQPTPTPPTASGCTFNNGLPVPDGSTPANATGYGVPGVTFSGTGGGAFVTANDLYYEPFNVQCFDIEINQISFLVTSAGNPSDYCRVGIAEADDEWQAGALVVDAGQVVNDSTGWKNTTTNLPVTLTPGAYVLMLVCNSGPALGDSSSHGSYWTMPQNSGSTSSTRYGRHLRDSAPAGSPGASGFSDPVNEPWDTIDYSTGGFGRFLVMRWSVS